KFAGQINDQGKSKNEYQDMVVADALALDRFEEMNYNASYYKAWEAMLLAQQLYNSYTVISGPSTITNTTTVTKNAEGFLALLVLIPLVFIGLRHRTNHRKI
ncbi:MAG TPA: hypothetical protein VJ044_01415, partial [Candidatus Hodarchaeales archaeon]|nr:hypothetical protein [Candidatus Hodarchaeales archaeon]